MPSLIRPAVKTTLLATALLLLANGDAEARPKIVNGSGCTLAQIQAPAAEACHRQTDSDLAQNLPEIHSLYCTSTGVTYCCKYNAAGGIVDHSCVAVSTAHPDIFKPGSNQNAPLSN